MRWFPRFVAVLSACLALSHWPCVALAQVPPPPAAKPATGNWKQLNAHEQRALAPLASQWGVLTETQRSKWLAIAQHFDKLSPTEQQMMQTRMTEWVSLSPTQRNQARLNFNTVQGLSKDEKKNRWDEYQALSKEDKQKLSSGLLAPAKTAAPTSKPSSADRLVQPTVRTLPAEALPPRTPIDRKTLLPMPATPTDVQSLPAEGTPAREASGS